MRKRKIGKTFSYFGSFVELSEYSLRAAELLIKTINNFKKDTLDEKLKEMHSIEHSADLKKHELLDRLVKEFLPPIEREDIISISEKIDTVTDSIEDVLINLSIFNVKSIPKEVLEFTEIIMNFCKSMISALREFENFKRSKILHTEIVELNRLEEVADELYVNNVRKLYRDGSDVVTIFTWKEIYDSLEKCCDACEDVANDIELVVMKNS